MGQVLPRSQVDDIGRRLQVVSSRAPPVQRRLEWEEVKYRLLYFVVATETKLRVWTVKYGYQSEVQAMLDDYRVSMFLFPKVPMITSIQIHVFGLS